MKKEEYIKMYKLENQHFWFLGKRSFVQTVLFPYKNSIKKILDIGSGTGGMTKFLSRYGEVVGIENSKTALELAKKRGVRVVQGNAQSLPFEDGSFELVTIFDVLYHKEVKSQKKVLSEARRVLKDKGHLLITDSAFGFLRGAHDEATFGARRYTLNQMSKLVKDCGYKILKSSYVYFTLFPLVFIKRVFMDRIRKNRGSDVGSVNPTINNLLIFILRMEAFFLKFVSFPVGLSVLVLAQKDEER